MSGTISFRLHIEKFENFNITSYYDADWGDGVDGRRSTSCSCVFLGNSLVSWASKKQHVVARRNTEAEYRSMANSVAKVPWLKSLLSKLHIPTNQAPIVLCDNHILVLMTANPIWHSRTKHIQLDIHFVRAKAITREIQIKHVSSCDQLAYGLTKGSLPKIMFYALIESLKVKSKYDFVKKG